MSENIKQLSEKDKVRRKISVWLGASNHIAVIHTVKELVGNSVDEINKGNGDRIKITLHNDKTITVEDNCKGLPFEGKNENGVENYKLLTETLFAGTKYDNGIENENYTVGTNGVFLTVLTFSSQKVEYEVSRPNGKVYSLSYEKGEIAQPFAEIGENDKTYTKIKYTLDDDVYEENYFTFDELCELASQQASLINGQIEVVDEINNIEKCFKYENGIRELLELQTSQLESIHDTIFFEKEASFEAKQDGKSVLDNMKISLALTYTKEDEDNLQIEFLNGSNLIHHGTIYDGLVSGLRNIINRYLNENNMYKKNEKQITKDDVTVGLNYIINFKSYFPVFANQTKFASYVKYYESVMKNTLESFFESYVIENKNSMDIIAKKVLVNKNSREKAEATRLNVKKKLSGTVNNLTNRVEGFVNCKSKDNTKTELYLVEGKSALGSTKQGRDAEFQAIYALRGKILNCLKADYDKIFKNDIIIDLIKLLGCGIEVKSKHAKDLHTFDISKLRWSKIVITTDADVDGFHIRTLLLTAIYRLMPTLIEKGYVYIAESPLYEIEQNDVSVFAYSDREKDQIIANMKGDYTVQRSKGLGENTAEMMWETTMNPETRKLIKVTPSDAENTLRYFEMFLGDDLSARKEYIEENLHLYIEDALD
ncbi:toprim domain-containing protein [Bacillus sp. FSL W8-0445]|uniref:toprim domain-containing protein n=1 Tax=Bacillota TaxID=1239 RepID=UPI00119F5785|nr:MULTISPECIES: toprim domain-containing protein [Bacillota]MDE1407108.1 toprim domain-containing protein [Bacillus licheniformis]NFT30669.1 DNA topoisomerase [Clostridium sporogenes]TWN76530.1 DNA gyrase subunit B [Bacillus licheniformis]GIN67110.1 DNA gyrase subunit B [Bacillus sonorensis]